MLEISTKDKEIFNLYKEKGKVYPGGVYDFTFENRFLIYHAPVLKTNVYYAIDTKTGYGSEVIRLKDSEVKNLDFKDLINPILYSIKYTGDNRYQNIFAHNTESLIDVIFRTILPKYGYAVREEQIRLSKKVFKGLTDKQVSICEAEVGTGKTMAYLVAAVCARKSLRRTHNVCNPVTITTSSIELQKAIIEKEIPQLSKMLMDYHLIDKPLTAVLRKGKEHYFCPDRYHDFMKTIKKYPVKHAATINYFNQRNFAETAFDLDRYNFTGSLKGKICVKGSCSNCKHKDTCRYFDFVNTVTDYRCSYDFQITNHNLFLIGNKEPLILRESSFVIIDEAHKLQEAARDAYGECISEELIPKYVAMIKTKCKETNKLIEYHSIMTDALTLSDTLFKSLRKRVLGKDSEYDYKSLIQLTGHERSCIASILSDMERLEEMRKTACGRIELNGKQIMKSLSKFLERSEISIWLNEEPDNSISLCCSENNVGNKLLHDVWSKKRGHVLLSGTMSDGKDFSFFKKENGLNRMRNDLMLESSSPSPFNYAEHTRLYLPADLPRPSNDYGDDYIDAIADKIVALIKATHGHTAILFTSYKALSLVYEKTKDRLSDYEVFCMSRTNKTAISDFKKSTNGVLFASGSMWEGVDCQGDVLSSVIIVRLPFPLRSASNEVKMNEYQNVQQFINAYAIPNMLIKLRQGMGRLIRNEDDTGLITILDTRASNNYYKPYIDGITNRYPKVNNIDEIAEFFATVKNKDYFD